MALALLGSTLSMEVAMAAKKTKSSKAKKTSRCWAGYEPVPGKKPHAQGSCRKK